MDFFKAVNLACMGIFSILTLKEKVQKKVKLAGFGVHFTLNTYPDGFYLGKILIAVNRVLLK